MKEVAQGRRGRRRDTLLLVGCLLGFAILLSQAEVEAAAVDNRMENLNPEFGAFSMYDTKQKRPFCNAFTGCGRKRSDPSVSVIGGLDLASDDDGESDVGNGGENNQLESLEQFMMLTGGGDSSRLQRTRQDRQQFGFFPGYL